MPLVVAFDLDGTLLDRNERIHPSDITRLAHPNGLIFIPATGRSLQPVKRIFANNGLFVGETFPFPLVLQNGAELYLPGELLCEHRTFPQSTCQQLLDLAQGFPQVDFNFFSLTTGYSVWNSPRIDEIKQRYNYSILRYTQAEVDAAIPISKVMAISIHPEDLSAVAEKAKDIAAEKAMSTPRIYELTPPGVNKGSGLRCLLDAMGLQNSRLLAAGDGGNDFPMLAMADVSFTPRTSAPHIQQAVRCVIDAAPDGLLGAMLNEITSS